MQPEWIHKAQKQLDDIVGPDRLPTFADRPHLPYIEATLRGECIVSMARSASVFIFLRNTALASGVAVWRSPSVNCRRRYRIQRGAVFHSFGNHCLRRIMVSASQIGRFEDGTY